MMTSDAESMALRLGLGAVYSGGRETLYVSPFAVEQLTGRAVVRPAGAEPSEGDLFEVTYHPSPDVAAEVRGELVRLEATITWEALRASLGRLVAVDSDEAFIAWLRNPVNRAVWLACPCDAPGVDLADHARFLREVLSGSGCYNPRREIVTNRPAQWERRAIIGRPCVLLTVGREPPVVVDDHHLDQFAAALRAEPDPLLAAWLTEWLTE